MVYYYYVYFHGYQLSLLFLCNVIYYIHVSLGDEDKPNILRRKQEHPTHITVYKHALVGGFHPTQMTSAALTVLQIPSKLRCFQPQHQLQVQFPKTFGVFGAASQSWNVDLP